MRGRLEPGPGREAKAERERRIVGWLNSGLSIREIAAREGITERGMRKAIRVMLARRAPEATAEFVAAQVSRLNEALNLSFSAMSAQDLAAVDRVVRIVRELDLYHGLGRGDEGTETRRKLLESLDSGAERAEREEGPRLVGKLRLGEDFWGPEAEPGPVEKEPEDHTRV